MRELKQVILVREDLKLPKGKMSAQVAHGSVESVLKSSKEILDRWMNEGQKKVVLKVKDEKELVVYFQKAKEKGLTASLIRDAGRTFLARGTKTVVAIGPDFEEKIDEITENLSMM